MSCTIYHRIRIFIHSGLAHVLYLSLSWKRCEVVPPEVQSSDRVVILHCNFWFMLMICKR